MYCASVFKLRLILVVQRSDLDCDVRPAHALSRAQRLCGYVKPHFITTGRFPPNRADH